MNTFFWGLLLEHLQQVECLCWCVLSDIIYYLYGNIVKFCTKYVINIWATDKS